MKNIFRLCVGSFFLVTAGNLSAQDSVPAKTLEQVTITATNTKVPEKVWKSFLKYYPTAESPKWYNLQNDFYVKYMMEMTPNQSVFTKKGNLVYTISYGNENDLPDYLKQEIKNKYLDYNIRGITKVCDRYTVVYLVHLEGTRNYITVKLDDKEMEEIQKFNKS